MATDTEPRKRAPTLYLIIAFKLLKGSLFLALAITVYALSDNDLPYEYRRLMHFLNVHPGNQFFQLLAKQVAELTESRMLWTAAGTCVYSLFSLIEGTGLMFRLSWSGWLAIGESIFFIPLEVYHLMNSWHWGVFVVFVMNVVIVWYLLKNRERLFRHHYH